jgi:ribosomal protein L23
MEAISKKQVILKPVLSEKSLTYYKNFKVCTFMVAPHATKKDIEFSFKQAFGIDAKAVRTVVQRKNRTVRNRKTYSANEIRTYVKKAYINIGESSLDIFESIN